MLKLALTVSEPEKAKMEVPIDWVSGEGLCEGALISSSYGSGKNPGSSHCRSTEKAKQATPHYCTRTLISFTKMEPLWHDYPQNPYFSLHCTE